MDGVGGVGDICTSGTNRGNDDEWLHHRLGQVTGVYFTFLKVPECLEPEKSRSCFMMQNNYPANICLLSSSSENVFKTLHCSC